MIERRRERVRLGEVLISSIIQERTRNAYVFLDIWDVSYVFFDKYVWIFISVISVWWLMIHMNANVYNITWKNSDVYKYDVHVLIVAAAADNPSIVHDPSFHLYLEWSVNDIKDTIIVEEGQQKWWGRCSTREEREDVMKHTTKILTTRWSRRWTLSRRRTSWNVTQLLLEYFTLDIERVIMSS